MRSDRWERIGAAAGIAAVVLIVVGYWAVPATPPDLGDTAAIGPFVSEHRAGIITQSYLISIGAIALIWFAGTLRTALRRAEGSAGRVSGIAFAGGGVAGALLIVSMAMYAAIALPGRAADSARISTLTDLAAVTLTLMWLPIAMLAGATALVSYRTGVFPRWHAIGGGVFAIAAVASGAMLYGTSGFFSLEPFRNASMILIGAFVAWMVATSTLMMVGEAEVVEPATTEEYGKVVWHRRKAG